MGQHHRLLFFILLVFILHSSISSASSTTARSKTSTKRKNTSPSRLRHNNSELEPQDSGRGKFATSSSVPSCKILRQMWRQFQKYSQMNNDIPEDLDQWLRGFSNWKNHKKTNGKNRSKNQGNKTKIYGKIIKNGARSKETGAFEVLRALTSDYRRQRSPGFMIPEQESQDSFDFGTERIEPIRGTVHRLSAEKEKDTEDRRGDRGDDAGLEIVRSSADATSDQLLTRRYPPTPVTRPFDLLRRNLSPFGQPYPVPRPRSHRPRGSPSPEEKESQEAQESGDKNLMEDPLP